MSRIGVRRVGTRLAAALLLTITASLAVAAPAWAQAEPTVTVDKVLVNRTGGITAMGHIDCSAVVSEMYGPDVPAGTTVYVNVDWTARQSAGRRLISAIYSDTQGSPCWSNVAAPGVVEFCQRVGLTEEWGNCAWDSTAYGSDGWIYGDGAFKTGAVHLALVVQGIDPPWDSLLYAERGFSVRATKS